MRLEWRPLPNISVMSRKQPFARPLNANLVFHPLNIEGLARYQEVEPGNIPRFVYVGIRICYHLYDAGNTQGNLAQKLCQGPTSLGRNAMLKREAVNGSNQVKVT